MKVRKVFKYGTGETIPQGASYVSTVVQTEREAYIQLEGKPKRMESCYFVWHYFLIEVEE